MLKNFTKMMRCAFAVAIGLCALAACAPNGMTYGFGTVVGRVVDRDSLQPIPGATVSVGNIVAITAAIDQGAFILRNVQVGTGTLVISAVGWQGYTTQVKVVKNKAFDVGVIALPSALNR
jgi:CarboxypepD_reg-like domain